MSNDTDAPSAPGDAAAAPSNGSQMIVPVVEERLAVAKRVVETGRVRIHKTVREYEEVVDEPLLRDEVVVETVAIDRVLDGEPPQARQDGDTWIVPVIEEVLIVEKRLMLKSELHIKRVQRTVHEPQTVTLRSEQVTIERLYTPPPPRDAEESTPGSGAI